MCRSFERRAGLVSSPTILSCVALLALCGCTVRATGEVERLPQETTRDGEARPVTTTVVESEVDEETIELDLFEETYCEVCLEQQVRRVDHQVRIPMGYYVGEGGMALLALISVLGGGGCLGNPDVDAKGGCALLMLGGAGLGTAAALNLRAAGEWDVELDPEWDETPTCRRVACPSDHRQPAAYKQISLCAGTPTSLHAKALAVFGTPRSAWQLSTDADGRARFDLEPLAFDQRLYAPESLTLYEREQTRWRAVAEIDIRGSGAYAHYLARRDTAVTAIASSEPQDCGELVASYGTMEAPEVQRALEVRCPWSPASARAAGLVETWDEVEDDVYLLRDALEDLREFGLEHLEEHLVRGSTTTRRNAFEILLTLAERRPELFSASAVRFSDRLPAAVRDYGKELAEAGQPLLGIAYHAAGCALLARRQQNYPGGSYSGRGARAELLRETLAVQTYTHRRFFELMLSDVYWSSEVTPTQRASADLYLQLALGTKKAVKLASGPDEP